MGSMRMSGARRHGDCGGNGTASVRVNCRSQLRIAQISKRKADFAVGKL